MSDKINKAAEVEGLMDELFDSKPKNIKGLKEVYQVPKPTVRDKKENTKVVHENHPNSGGTVIHGENAQVVHNHKVIDYKIDNTAIDEGRASVGIRKRGERVDPRCMSPREFENYLYHKFKIPGKRGWNGIERSDFADNWEPNESQVITTREEALKYLGLKETSSSPDGIEKRSIERRKKQPDIRKVKTERRSKKPRRKVEKQNKVLDSIVHVLTFIICISVYLILWSIAS
jgi:hypothetical protein